MRSRADAWTRFWFEPQPTSTLALVRVAFGLIVLAWTVALLPDLNTFFSTHGLFDHPPVFHTDGLWGPFDVLSGDGAMLLTFAVLLISSVCLTLGLFTRLAAVLVFLGVLAFTRRNPYVFNSGDALIRNIAFFIALTPAGASWSLDRLRRRREDFWSFPARAPWGLRLLQIQVSILYLTAVWDKVRSGPSWNDGTAISYVQRIGDVRRFGMPDIATNSPLTSLLTYGTMAVELSLAILIWNRRARPWVLGVGIALHLAIDLTIRVGFFSLVAIAALLAFLAPGTVGAWLLWLRGRTNSLRGGAEPVSSAS